jgi:hypothetical protein
MRETQRHRRHLRACLFRLALTTRDRKYFHALSYDVVDNWTQQEQQRLGQPTKECLQEKLRLRSDVRLLLRLRYSILRITVAAGFRVFEIKTSHLSYRFLASGERAAPAALT